ncbi:thermostable 8-oxoguanine DNA glycosylase [Microvirga flocculans]|uniref:Thermostable 8-oxoguanine DNA glycosylase n=1 Tax=Microvirga flocculans TaxID=217168 RepID=A0A7W6N7R7_9HYPH|nr:endonuclease III domain-containing protein [Microvirga flocculans]MBB4039856.1 thermostable 8-oxoguanine DNA glycosylase [Microvirga flocculans]
MQRVIAEIAGRYAALDLPDADEWLMPGVRWGRFDHALTPAFWVSQAWMSGDATPTSFQLGQSLVEEVVVCLLGGHGTPAEVGLAAAERICQALRDTTDGILSHDACERLLVEPLAVRGRTVRYRFARQRAKYLAGSLRGLRQIAEADLTDLELRDALCRLPGIGPKTASWIVRNRRASDKVAILDVHIVRACQIMGVFPERADPARHYARLEGTFLEFCSRAHARASVVDAVMWTTMRQMSRPLLNRFVDPEPGFGFSPAATQQEGISCQDRAVRAATLTPARAARAAVRAGPRLIPA